MDTTSVDGYVASLTDERTTADARTLIEMMGRITGHDPRLWNVGTIGFDSYHFAYDSGREGEGHAAGFYPRKNKLTVYLMDGTARHSALLDRLGAHTTSRVCVYIKRLDDVDLGVLEQVIRDSYSNLKEQDGAVKRV